MSKLIIIVGIAGSGKSTYAKRLLLEMPEGTQIFSSDDLREELYGFQDQTRNTELFQELGKSVRNHLETKGDCILDATNLSKKKRIAFINGLPKGTVVEAHVIATALQQCLSNNLKRSRQVPSEVIYKQFESFHFPVLGEGFSLVKLIKSDDESGQYDFDDLVDVMKGVEQENPWHNLPVGEHCQAAAKYFIDNFKYDKNSSFILKALYIHDIGKLYTKTYEDKEDGTRVAHYFGHENVSSYIAAACRGINDVRVPQLIQYHMIKLDKLGDKGYFRLQGLIGQELFDALAIFNQCDAAGKS